MGQRAATWSSTQGLCCSLISVITSSVSGFNGELRRRQARQSFGFSYSLLAVCSSSQQHDVTCMSRGSLHHTVHVTVWAGLDELHADRLTTGEREVWHWKGISQMMWISRQLGGWWDVQAVLTCISASTQPCWLTVCAANMFICSPLFVEHDGWGLHNILYIQH